jgi:DNA-binding NtrC family response regulator
MIHEAGMRMTRTPSRPLEGLHVQIVEDELLVGLDAQMMLEEAGARVRLAAEPMDARRQIDGAEVTDVAVLDLKLAETVSAGLAGLLRERGIPFIFATGYSNADWLGDGFSDVPIVSKPYTAAEIVSAVARVLNGSHRPLQGPAEAAA